MSVSRSTVFATKLSCVGGVGLRSGESSALLSEAAVLQYCFCLLAGVSKWDDGRQRRNDGWQQWDGANGQWPESPHAGDGAHHAEPAVAP